MKRTRRERVTRTYCDRCGDVCKTSIVYMGGEHLCEKRECRQHWHDAIRMNIIVNDIKEQPYF